MFPDSIDFSMISEGGATFPHSPPTSSWPPFGSANQKNRNTAKIWLILVGEYDDRSITYIINSKSFLFRILSTPAWSLEVGRPFHHLVQPLDCLQHGLKVQKNRNTVKIWLILVG